jgi:hypothetical protein
MTPQTIAREAAHLARLSGASSAREAAEITMGRPLTKWEWEQVKTIWEEAWDYSPAVH